MNSRTRVVASVAASWLALAGGLLAQPGGDAAAQLAGWFELRPAEPDGKTPFAVQGWALATCGASEVRVAVDGEEVWRGDPSFAWPGVTEKYPGVAGAESAGFWAQIDPTRFAEGEHRLAVTMVACGREQDLGGAAFRTAPPTPAWLAWPLLALLLGAFPAVGGWALARRESRAGTIPALPVKVALLLAALIATVAAARHVGTSAIAAGAGLFAPLANWDGRYYLLLATEGHSPEHAAAYAFFPLYPALLRLLSYLPLPLPLAAALANAGLFLAAILVLRRLYPGEDRGIAVFACLPFAFFFVVTYTESLALVLAAGFLLALRRERTGWALLLGVAAGLTRISSLPLALFALDFVRRRRFKQAGIAVAAPAAGLALWMLWLWRTTGDPWKFLHVQTEFGRTTSFHPGRLLDQIGAAAASRQGQSWWELALLLLVLTGAAALAASGRWGEGAYSAAVVLLPLATLRLTSLNRYALAAFPVYLLLGGLLRRQAVFRLVVALELAALFFYAARFGRQYWVG